jgi:hypothetical protein
MTWHRTRWRRRCSSPRDRHARRSLMPSSSPRRDAAPALDSAKTRAGPVPIKVRILEILASPIAGRRRLSRIRSLGHRGDVVGTSEGVGPLQGVGIGMLLCPAVAGRADRSSRWPAQDRLPGSKLRPQVHVSRSLTASRISCCPTCTVKRRYRKMNSASEGGERDESP